jgi:hypothetical protein
MACAKKDICCSGYENCRNSNRLSGTHGATYPVRTLCMSEAAIGRLSTVKMGYWPPLIIIGCVTYAPLSGVYECPLCSHGPRGPVGV